MAKQTLREQFKFGLERLGYSQDYNCRSSKYIKMSHPGRTDSYFLGTHGGLRYGRIASDTIGLWDSSRNKLLKIASIPQAKWEQLQADKR